MEALFLKAQCFRLGTAGIPCWAHSKAHKEPGTQTANGQDNNEVLVQARHHGGIKPRATFNNSSFFVKKVLEEPVSQQALQSDWSLSSALREGVPVHLPLGGF